MKERVETLDWLRGLMAISIMFYHLKWWYFPPLESSSILGKLGIYGVSIFFILSGLSMAIVYNNFIVDFKTSVKFYVRRIFRIWPLLWVCIALVTIPQFIASSQINVGIILTNMTTIFGFYNPSGYINTGAWSIGNEMVYYSVTPLLIILYNQNKALGNLATFMSFLALSIFALFLLSPENLSDQWEIYINPLNNIFFYFAGIATYYNFRNLKLDNTLNYSLMFLSVLVFIITPVHGDRVNMVIGFRRYIFTFSCLLLVFSLYRFNQYEAVPNSISIILEKFGVATYGVYLLHPIISFYLESTVKRIGYYNPYFHFSYTFILTIILALLSYNLFEKRFIEIGKFLTK